PPLPHLHSSPPPPTPPPLPTRRSSDLESANAPDDDRSPPAHLDRDCPLAVRHRSNFCFAAASFGSTARTCSSREPASTYRFFARSEDHTSELQSLAYLVCRLLLEKKKI